MLLYTGSCNHVFILVKRSLPLSRSPPRQGYVRGKITIVRIILEIQSNLQNKPNSQTLTEPNQTKPALTKFSFTTNAKSRKFTLQSFESRNQSQNQFQIRKIPSNKFKHKTLLNKIIIRNKVTQIFA